MYMYLVDCRQEPDKIRFILSAAVDRELKCQGTYLQSSRYVPTGRLLPKQKRAVSSRRGSYSHVGYI